MEISLEVINSFCNVVKIARQIYEKATPIRSFDELKSYEVSTSDLEALGGALQKLGERLLVESVNENLKA